VFIDPWITNDSKKQSPSWEAEVSLQCWQEPAIGPILNHMNTVHTVRLYFFIIHSNIILHLGLGLSNRSFHPGFPIQVLYALLTPPMYATFRAHLILTILSEEENHELPRFAVFSILPLSIPSQFHIFSSLPSSQTPSIYVYVLPLMWEAKFHTHTEQRNTELMDVLPCFYWVRLLWLSQFSVLNFSTWICVSSR
jgi:hypothetical protein